ncbi:hypothetical protein [Mycobacterium kyorinense]|uniref:Uncharacterized protein n=1 Tax=Mycobacterium kyorinense TaxID=487514 RepID=A0A1X1XUG7_9MYCO|nr:hypothetical protein [Mycobacterium kyorinense]ORW02476.1 hypothetical protein AWC14_07005 [Mycobacterium kyorinense]
MTVAPPTRQQIHYVEQAVTRLRTGYLRAAAYAKSAELDALYAAAGDLRAMSDALRELRLAAEDR